MPNLEQKSMPSDKQIREFWEWCGFTNVKYVDVFWEWQGWLNEELIHIPYLDDIKALGFLFKYAVPKVNEAHSIYFHIGKILSTCVLSPYFNHLEKQSGEQHQSVGWLATCPLPHPFDEDPTLALFWAIWEVIKK